MLRLDNPARLESAAMHHNPTDRMHDDSRSRAGLRVGGFVMLFALVGAYLVAERMGALHHGYTNQRGMSFNNLLLGAFVAQTLWACRSVSVVSTDRKWSKWLQFAVVLVSAASMFAVAAGVSFEFSGTGWLFHGRIFSLLAVFGAVFVHYLIIMFAERNSWAMKRKRAALA